MKKVSMFKTKVQHRLWQMLGLPSYFQSLEQRLEDLETEMRIQQSRAYTYQTNNLFLFQQTPLDEYEGEMARLEKIFNANSDVLIRTTWWNMRKGPAEHFRLANGC